MPAAQAAVATSQPAAYLNRLCGHAGKMSTVLRRLHQRPLERRPPEHGDGAPPRVLDVRRSGAEATVVLDCGQWTMRAVPGQLLLRAEAREPESLRRVQDLLSARLSVLGRREGLIVTWHAIP